MSGAKKAFASDMSGAEARRRRAKAMQERRKRSKGSALERIRVGLERLEELENVEQLPFVMHEEEEEEIDPGRLGADAPSDDGDDAGGHDLAVPLAAHGEVFELSAGDSAPDQIRYAAELANQGQDSDSDDETVIRPDTWRKTNVSRSDSETSLETVDAHSDSGNNADDTEEADEDDVPAAVIPTRPPVFRLPQDAVVDDELHELIHALGAVKATSRMSDASMDKLIKVGNLPFYELFTREILQCKF